MKKTMFLLFAAIALFAAASCQKESEPQNSETPLTITCTFEKNAQGNKSTLDGLTPKWSVGDVFRVYGFLNDGTPKGYIDVTVTTAGAKFSFDIPAEWGLGLDDFIYAAYPASVASGAEHGYGDSEQIFFSVPSTQDGSFANANICVARAAIYERTLSFRNVTTILKLTVPSGIYKKIVVSNGGFGVISGPMKACNIGGTLGVALNGEGSQVINVDVNSSDVYISLSPCHNLLGVYSSFEFILADGTTVDKTIYTSNNNNLFPNLFYNLGAFVPTNVAPKQFSVSSDKKVFFSMGNLYYTGSAWSLEDNQYSFASTWSTTHVSQFFWVKNTETAFQPYSPSYGTPDPANTASDVLFTNATADTPNAGFTVGGTTGAWRTLTKDEWFYLLNTRSVNGQTGEGHSYQRTTITLSDFTTRFGLIIAPDGYESDLKSTYTWSEWQTAEYAGCIFLPAAGLRDGSDVDGGGASGNYLTGSLKDADTPYCVCFKEDEAVNPATEGVRDIGCAIRLVTD